jgi:ketosteroid isomerase-like protein
MRKKDFVLGFGCATAGRALLPKLLRLKFRQDLKRLNAGDYASLLAAYSDDFVLHFNEGDHRWSGDWIGKVGMERFLQNFTGARMRGEIRQVALSGPPWAPTIWARFDDHADAPDGTRIYQNRTALVLRTRWGKIVEQDDFYADTAPITTLERKLIELGIPAIPKPS